MNCCRYCYWVNAVLTGKILMSKAQKREFDSASLRKVRFLAIASSQLFNFPYYVPKITTKIDNESL